MMMPVAISHERIGLTNRWPRLRDHISSRKAIESERLPRTTTSHSSSPDSSTPAAWATNEACGSRYCVMKPHITICTAGQ